MRDDSLYLRHILDAIEAICQYTGTTAREEFIQNPILRDAVIRQLEIIGEASNRLSDETRLASPDTQWAQIISMRNRLIHGYFQVDVDLVWEIITNDLPALKQQIESIV